MDPHFLIQGTDQWGDSYQYLCAGAIRGSPQNGISQVRPDALGPIRDALESLRLLAVDLARDIGRQGLQHVLVCDEIVVERAPRQSGLFPDILYRHPVYAVLIEKLERGGEYFGARARPAYLACPCSEIDRSGLRDRRLALHDRGTLEYDSVSY
jgi:hypothetical protein